MNDNFKDKPGKHKPGKDEPSFADLMTGVARLDNDRINVYQHRVKKAALPVNQAESAELTIDFSAISYHSLSAIKDTYFNSGMQKKLQKKIRRGLLMADDYLDLHGCNQQQAITQLLQFIERALSSNLRFLIIVHGKGNRSDKLAVLKPLVHQWLAQQSMVLAWCPAQTRHGGSGASYVYLRSAASA